MINLTDRDGDTILMLDEKQNPIRQIVKRQKITLILCIIILLLLIFAGGFYIKTAYLERQVGLIAIIDSDYAPPDIPSPDPIAIPIPEEDKIDELNDKLSLGQMCINMVSSVTFKDAYSSGRLNVINSPANNYPQFVTLTLDTNHAVIYQSGLIDPGKCIPFDTLDVVLAKGTYNCTATFIQVDPQTEKICGKAAAKVVITIQN